MKWLRVIGAVLFIISVGMIAWGWYFAPRMIVGEVPLASQPSTPVAPITAPVPSTSPEASDQVPFTAVPAMEDMDSSPVHIQIGIGSCTGGEISALTCADMAPTGLDDKDVLKLPPGKASWYGPPDWSTIPGNLSGYPGIVAAHVTHGGKPDVFYRLSEARAGDPVILTYANGQTATFELNADPMSVGKDDVTDEVKRNNEYAWVWRLDEPGRVISLFTCDPSQGRDITGHSLNNWVVQATRIA